MLLLRHCTGTLSGVFTAWLSWCSSPHTTLPLGLPHAGGSEAEVEARPLMLWQRLWTARGDRLPPPPLEG